MRSMSSRFTSATTIALSLAIATFAGCAARPAAQSPEASKTRGCDPCEGGGPQTAEARVDRDDVRGPLGQHEGAYGSTIRSRSLSTVYEEPQPAVRSSRWDVRRIGASSQPGHASGARPPRTKKVDIDLSAAPFEEVMRLLGDTGKFNVVVQEGAASNVTIRLRNVEPYDALVVIAEARGIDVDYRRGVVVVGAPVK